jgi:hypothetical protein
MPGLDPGIHLAANMDCRVKLGNDDEGKDDNRLWTLGRAFIKGYGVGCGMRKGGIEWIWV